MFEPDYFGHYVLGHQWSYAAGGTCQTSSSEYAGLFPRRPNTQKLVSPSYDQHAPGCRSRCATLCMIHVEQHLNELKQTAKMIMHHLFLKFILFKKSMQRDAFPSEEKSCNIIKILIK